MGSIVTKSIERFSIVKGIPAKGMVNKQQYWSISQKKISRDRAKYYVNKYLNK